MFWASGQGSALRLCGRALFPRRRPWEWRAKAHEKGPLLTLLPRESPLGMGSGDALLSSLFTADLTVKSPHKPRALLS